MPALMFGEHWGTALVAHGTDMAVACVVWVVALLDITSFTLKECNKCKPHTKQALVPWSFSTYVYTRVTAQGPRMFSFFSLALSHIYNWGCSTGEGGIITCRNTLHNLGISISIETRLFLESHAQLHYNCCSQPGQQYWASWTESPSRKHSTHSAQQEKQTMHCATQASCLRNFK